MGRSYSYGRQSIDEDDRRAVEEVLRSDWLTQGPAVGRFEAALREACGARHAAAVANGTAGLHLAGLALGWGPGDVVITTPITFLASANCILYAGARADFVDIDPVTYTLDPARLEERLEQHRRAGTSVKAVVAVDYAGLPCDWAALGALAQRYGFQLVDDACHALGATLDGDPGYGVKRAQIVVLSFHPVKHITTGEGGAVLTDDPALDERVRTLRTHGMVKDEKRLRQNDGPWYYEMHELGFNYRITDLQCALGVSQLRKLSGFLTARRRIAEQYDAAFATDDRFVIPARRSAASHAYHLYPLRIRLERIGRSRAEVFARLKAAGVNCQVHYIPVHLQPYYRERFGFRPGDCPVAERFYAEEISIPMYPGLGSDDVHYIVEEIRRAVA
ncbi:MAG: UDP-4-amino-4,6-dideoxy-N-acetyl-beta-L-altrosamine transaminase [Deltaproteobacteria bacterium]|nr:UDP-4-amino-4,6-dideoxy-N-acetyl-beta-L-altrosamine transaminase [Deltaproteobacteria bacterium]